MKNKILKLAAILMVLGPAAFFTIPVTAAPLVIDYSGTFSAVSPFPDNLGLNGASFQWSGTFDSDATPSFTNGSNFDRFTGTITLTLAGTAGGIYDGVFAGTTNTIGELFGSGGNDQLQLANANSFMLDDWRLSVGTLLLPAGFTGAASPTNTLTPPDQSDILNFTPWSAFLQTDECMFGTPDPGECDWISVVENPQWSFEIISPPPPTIDPPPPAAEVPEPATLALLGLGLAGMGFGRRKKKV